MIKQLNGAFKKPAYDGRIIFLDLNTEPSGNTKPEWVEKAGQRLDEYEQFNKNGGRELPDGESAYVIITNMSFHRELDSSSPSRLIMAHGLGNDFWRRGPCRLSEIYRTKKKHLDIHNLIEALRKYPQIPSTFNGELPSEAFGEDKKRVVVGETYFFEDIGEKGLIGTVTSAIVAESEKQIYIAVSTEDGKSVILHEAISDDALTTVRLTRE